LIEWRGEALPLVLAGAVVPVAAVAARVAAGRAPRLLHLGALGELDLKAIEWVVQAKDPRGERPYSPELMTSLLLYAYATGPDGRIGLHWRIARVAASAPIAERQRATGSY
jgi:hypothetical protein